MECSICFGNYTPAGSTQPQLLTGCGHDFCKQCTSQISQSGRSKCPTCRLDFTPAHVVPFHHLIRTLQQPAQASPEAGGAGVNKALSNLIGSLWLPLVFGILSYAYSPSRWMRQLIIYLWVGHGVDIALDSIQNIGAISDLILRLLEGVDILEENILGRPLRPDETSLSKILFKYFDVIITALSLAQIVYTQINYGKSDKLWVVIVLYTIGILFVFKVFNVGSKFTFNETFKFKTSELTSVELLNVLLAVSLCVLNLTLCFPAEVFTIVMTAYSRDHLVPAWGDNRFVLATLNRLLIHGIMLPKSVMDAIGAMFILVFHSGLWFLSALYTQASTAPPRSPIMSKILSILSKVPVPVLQKPDFQMDLFHGVVIIVFALNVIYSMLDRLSILCVPVLLCEAALCVTIVNKGRPKPTHQEINTFCVIMVGLIVAAYAFFPIHYSLHCLYLVLLTKTHQYPLLLAAALPLKAITSGLSQEDFSYFVSRLLFVHFIPRKDIRIVNRV